MIAPNKSRRQAAQSGQAIVLLALAMVGILAFVVLALDGGRYYTQRRAAQNAADMAALAGLYQYQTGTGITKSDQAVVKQINHIAEINGIPDSDSTPDDGAPTFTGDATNNNVLAYWVNKAGEYVPDKTVSGCSGAANQSVSIEPPLACALIVNDPTKTKPDTAEGIRARVHIPYATFIAGLIGQTNLVAQADGIALTTFVDQYYARGSDKSLWMGGGSTCGTTDNPAFYIGTEGPMQNNNFGDTFVNGAATDDGGQQKLDVGDLTISGTTNGAGGTGNPLDGKGNTTGSYQQGSQYAPAPGKEFPEWAYLDPGKAGPDLPPVRSQIQADFFRPDTSFHPEVTNVVDVPAGHSTSEIPSGVTGNYIYQQYILARKEMPPQAPANFYHYINNGADAKANNADLAAMIAAGKRGVFYIDGDWFMDTSTTQGSGSDAGITVIVRGRAWNDKNANNMRMGSAGSWGYHISVLAGGYPPPPPGSPPAPNTNACAGPGTDGSQAIFQAWGQQVDWDEILYVPNGLATIDANHDNKPQGPIIAYSFGMGYPGHPENNLNLGQCTSCFSHPILSLNLYQ